MSGRKFGVELEIVNMDINTALVILQGLDIPVSSETNYRHGEYNQWKVMSDASLRYQGRGTCEVVSRILQGEEGIEELKKVCRALSNAGATVNNSCGLHVHMDASDLTGDNIRHIITRYAHHEAIIDNFMPRSRRANANSFCQSMVQQLTMFNPGNSMSTNGWFTNDASRVTYALGARYLKVNTVCYRNYRTIEFRQHSGSVNASKVSNWVQFLQQFVAYSVATTPRVQNSVQETVTRVMSPVSCNYAGTPTPWSHTNRNWNYRLSYGHTKIQNYLLQNVNQYVTVAQIASYVRMNEQSVPSYISAIRNAWGVTIKNSRSRGYMLVWSPASTTNTATEQPANQTEVISTPTHNVISDSLWDGIHENLRSYYEERTMELA